MVASQVRVIAEPVGKRREHLIFWILTAIVIASVSVIAIYWLGLEDRSTHPVLYVLVTGLLLFHLGIWGGRWASLLKMRRPVPLAPDPDLRVAAVTTFHPGAEPIEMLEQTVRALVALRYPHDTWVLDEGDSPAVHELCQRLGALHFSRKDRAEYQGARGPFQSWTKHGNYNAWLSEIGYQRYEHMVAFDTDHVPEPEYLDRVLGYFRDPEVGYVQAPQVYYNQEASFIARGAAEETYAYYSSHQMASYAVGHPILTGCHNAQRLSALQKVGGLPAHDAEDLLLTLRYRGQGWRGVYVPEVLALGITPVDWAGYLRQQTRWARAVLDIKLREYPAIMRKLPPVEKAAGLLHGVYYLRALTFPVVYALIIGLVLTGVRPSFIAPGTLARLGLVVLLIAAVDRYRQDFYLDPKRERGTHWRALLLQFAKWPFLMLALVQAVRSPSRAYDATQKARSNPVSFRFAFVHLVIAATIAAAWFIGGIGSHVPLTLTVLCMAIVLLSVGLAWTALWHYADPFDAELATRRRAELSDLFPNNSTSGTSETVKCEAAIPVNWQEKIRVLNNDRVEGALGLATAAEVARHDVRNPVGTQL